MTEPCDQMTECAPSREFQKQPMLVSASAKDIPNSHPLLVRRSLSLRGRPEAGAFENASCMHDTFCFFKLLGSIDPPLLLVYLES